MREDFNYDDYEDTFDIVFTSPPYFNVERYSYDDTDKRYKNIDTEYSVLQRTLDNLWPTIRGGGKLCVNISDVNAQNGSSKKNGFRYV